jgi:hypothetical protein
LSKVSPDESRSAVWGVGLKERRPIIKRVAQYLAVAALGFAAFLAGCSSIRVGNDYDPSVDYARYRSFDWLDNRPGVAAAAEAAETVDARLRDAVGSELAAKGLTRDQVNPELLVIYHVGTDTGIDAGRWGYRYEEAGKGWGGDIDVRAYRTGTLVLDLVDAATMRLVWRASAESVIRKKDTPKDTEERVADAVHRMLQAYPPVG